MKKSRKRKSKKYPQPSKKIYSVNTNELTKLRQENKGNED